MNAKLKKIAARVGLGLALVALSAFGAAGQSAYQSELGRWRRQQESELKASDGWLTVAGLFWLKEGPNSFGTGADNAIVLPGASAPGRTGTFVLRRGVVTLSVEDGARVTVQGEPIRAIELQPDTAEKPTVVQVGELSLTLIKRGERYGIRLRDQNSPGRREFKGLRWYPARASYRVTARFVPHEQPTELSITNVLGDVLKLKSPGTLFFTLDGHEYSLEPVGEEDGTLFIIFRDLTSGKSTYPAGRFLYAAAPVGGRVTLDFNRAVNPPCAFTPYATCPLPPRQNRLKVAIKAGELTYHSPITRND